MASLCWPGLVCLGQTPAGAGPEQTPAQSAPAAPTPPSGLLQPALDTVQQTLGTVNLERWKKGNIREEAGDNIGKILRDVKETLPPLLSDSDAAPGSNSKMLPVARNVAALYDVLLRVVEASRVSAPAEQVTSLQRALISLSEARLALDSRMQDAAIAMEKQVSDLRVTVQKQAAFKCPAPPPPVAKPCVPPAPRRRVRRKATPPAATTPNKPGTPGTTPPKKPGTTPQKKPATPGTTPSKAGT
ncbi:MAG: hypothetical protein WAM85_10730 [Terracidiphilus sp.]